MKTEEKVKQEKEAKAQRKHSSSFDGSSDEDSLAYRD